MYHSQNDLNNLTNQNSIPIKFPASENIKDQDKINFINEWSSLYLETTEIEQEIPKLQERILQLKKALEYFEKK